MPSVTANRHLTYDDILSTTLQVYRPSLVDAVFKSIPFFWYMFDKGRVKHQRGGESIWVTIHYRKNNTTTWFSQNDTLNTTPQQQFTTAAYDWRYISGSVSIDMTDEQKNSGTGRLKDLLRARIESLQLGLRDDISEALFDLTTGVAAKAKQMYGLQDIIQAVAPASQTNSIGGIPKSVITAGIRWWANQFVDCTDFDGTLGSTNSALVQMDNLYLTQSEGQDHPDIIVTSQTPYFKAKNFVIANQRWFGSDDRLLRTGFQNWVFNGAVVVMDKAATLAASDAGNGLMYMLNTNYLYFVTDPAYEFRPTPFKQPSDQLTRVAQVVTAANLVCSNMRRQGVMSGLET